MATTVLQLQDGHRHARGHPVSHVLPAAPAMAEESIGAAVAAAWLLGRDRDREARARLIEAAIGNAATVALFPFRDTCMEGAGAHHLFVGLGVQNGITAARAALASLPPSPATLERFFGPRAGEGFDPALLKDGIGADGR